MTRLETRVRNCLKNSKLTYSEVIEKTSWWRLTHIACWGKACEQWFQENARNMDQPLWFWREEDDKTVK
jgi:hypothetical protein